MQTTRVSHRVASFATLTAAALLLLSGTPRALGEDVTTFDVRDLLQGGRATGRLAPIPHGHPVLHEGYFARTQLGAPALGLIPDDESTDDEDETPAQLTEPLLTEEELRDALWALAGDAAEGIVVNGGAFTVASPAAGAASVRSSLALLRSLRAMPMTVRATLTATDSTGSRVLLSGEGPAEPGRTQVISDCVASTVVTGFDVEIAEASNIAEPVMRDQRFGAAFVYRVRLLPRRRSAVVELLACATTGRDGAPISPGHSGFGSMDRSAMEVEELGTTFVVARGRESVHRWTSADGSTRELRFQANWAAPPADPAGYAICWTDLGDTEVTGFRSHLNRRPWTNEDSPHPGTQRILADEPLGAALEGARSIVAAQSTSGLVLLRGEDAIAVADAFDAATARSFSSCNVSVRAYDVPAGATPGTNGAAPAGATLLAEFSGPVLADLPTSFLGLRAQRYLAGWSVEVASAARTPDPVCWTEENGTVGSLLARAGVDGGPETVSLDLDLSRLLAMDQRSTPLDQALPPRIARAYRKDDDGDPVPDAAVRFDSGLPQNTVAIELPRTAESNLRATFTVSGGAVGLMRRSARNLLGDGREILVIVTAK
jgi:hypothetical protein